MSGRQRSLVAALVVAFGCAAMLTPSEGEARPGGGSSFSGSSGSRSGSSSSSSSSSGSRSSSSSSSGFRSSSSTSTSSSSGFRSSSSTSTSGYSTSSSTSSGAASTPDTFSLEPSVAGRERTDNVARFANGVSPYPPAPAPGAWPTPRETSGEAVGIVLAIPAIFLFGVALGIWALVRFARRKNKTTGWSTAVQSAGWTTMTQAAERVDLDPIRVTDPDFSAAIFEDFLYFLYTQAHTARGQGQLARLAPWLSPRAMTALNQRGVVPVSAIVIGAMRFLRFDTRDPSRYSVQVELETNYTEQHRTGAQAFWVTERWWLTRARNAKSRPPERARVFDCAGCGAPLDQIVGHQCRHCGRVVDTGELDWRVEAIETVQVQPRGPMLTGETIEVGTDLPTVVDPQLPQRLAQLQAADPAFDMRALHARVGLVFSTMQTAWSSLEWHRARPFLSDNLYEAQRYWIEAYRNAGLRNVTTHTRILRIDTARVTQDKWFTAITLRIYATGYDYTIRDADQRVVGGNRTKARTYSEYWTLLRGTGVTGKIHADPVCPKCGAPLDVSMAGNCKSCQVKVSSGKFDWVLARIEQDEAYSG